MKRWLAILLLVCMLVVPLAACGNNGGDSDTGSSSGDSTGGKYDTLVVQSIAFEEKWNPFYAESAYDRMVIEQVFSKIMMVGEGNVMIDDAGSVTWEEIEADDGHTQVLYTVKLKEGLKYSDGTDVTIDDVIFGYKVWADPSYTGPWNVFWHYDIVGIKEYYYDDPDYTAKVAAIAQEVTDNYSSDTISEEDFLTYLIDTNLEGWWEGDPAGDVGDGRTWSQYITDEGFETELGEIDATNADAMLELLAKVEYTNYADGYDPASWWTAKLSEDYIAGNLDDGIDVPEIEGIQKVDDLTCTVLFDSVNFLGDRIVTDMYVAPEHIYGVGYEKGNTTSIEAMMNDPIGCGPYLWGGFGDNIATVTANDDYFKGEPKTKTVKFQRVDDNDIPAAMTAGEIDIANPTASNEKLAAYEADGKINYLIDNNGYGYIGLNANNMDINVRKGMMHLFNRGPAVEGYYGDIASVIERPMTTTLAEYPTDAAEVYGYDPTKALEYFEAAGYSQDASGKLVNSSGNQLILNVYVGGDGKGDHPSYAILTQAQTAMEDLGGVLDIQDVAFNVLQAAMNDGTADMFCLAWGASDNCDRSSQYKTGGGQNRMNVSNARLDEVLDEILLTLDLEERSALVAEMLDIVMDEAVEMPVYQRKNLWVVNPEIVNTDSLPEISTYWTPEKFIWEIELN